MSGNWPEPEDVSGLANEKLAEALYSAMLQNELAVRRAAEDRNARRDREAAERECQETAADDRLREAVHLAYLDVAKGTIDRTVKRAELVATFAASIGTIYAGILALSYSAKDGSPLPPEGVVPALFLSASLVFSAAFLSMLQRRTTAGPGLARGEGAIQSERVSYFVKWVNGTALLNSWALRSAVVCLGLGVGTLPLPFVDIPAVPFVVLAGLALAGWLLFELGRWRRSSAVKAAGTPTRRRTDASE